MVKRKQKKESRHLGTKAVLILVVVAGVAGHKQASHALHEAHGFLTSAPSGTAAANKQYARHEMKVAYGWGGHQFGCLDDLWTGESSWSQTADTRTSGLDPAGAKVFAYGVPQARGHGDVIGGVTAPYPPAYSAANPPSLGGKNSARTQIRWGLDYIRWNPHFHTPCSALAYKHANGNQGY